MRQSKANMKAAKEKSDAALNRTNKKIDELGQETNTLYEQLTTIHGQFDAIRNLPSEQRVKFEKTKRIRSEWKDQVEKIQKDYNQAAAKAAGMGAAGAGLGVAVVTLGPAAAMGIATTFGVASTGTAISALSGAAATNRHWRGSAAEHWLPAAAVWRQDTRSSHSQVLSAGRSRAWRCCSVALCCGRISSSRNTLSISSR